MSDNDRSPVTVTVLGAGYVGLSTAALFAGSGIKTYLIEPDATRLNSVKAGKSFFYEEGLDPLIEYSINRGFLIPTSSYRAAIPNSNIIFSAVGTPDKPNGSSNLDFVYSAASRTAKYIQQQSIFVQKSTVPVGTGNKIKRLFQSANVDVSYVSNPEFLREGTGLVDSLWYDRIVVGCDQPEAAQAVVDLYKQVEDHRDQIIKICGNTPPANITPGKVIKTSLESAEMIKVAANAFLTLKISFANSIAKLADKTNADIVDVMQAVGADKRIGQSFLNAGRGYGGGCFPKDLSSLIAVGREKGINLDILKAVQAVNESMPQYIVDKLKSALGSINGKTIAILGLSFKAGTSDTRRSPGIAIADILSQQHASVQAFDPKANHDFIQKLDNKVKVVKSIEAALVGSDGVIVATDWPEFLNFAPDDYARLMKGNVFFDAMNRFDPETMLAAGLQYLGVGRGKYNTSKTTVTIAKPELNDKLSFLQSFENIFDQATD